MQRVTGLQVRVSIPGRGERSGHDVVGERQVARASSGGAAPCFRGPRTDSLGGGPRRLRAIPKLGRTVAIADPDQDLGGAIKRLCKHVLDHRVMLACGLLLCLFAPSIHAGPTKRG